MVAFCLQGLILVKIFPRKARTIKNFLSKSIFTFAVAGLFADPVLSRNSHDKPSTRRTAKFNYEVGFELIRFDFNVTSLRAQTNNLKTHLNTIRKTKPLLSSNAENNAVESLLLDCEVKTNSTENMIDQIRDFFEEEGSERDQRSAEFLGELWHEVSGAPGPLEYHKEVEAFHIIETTIRHSTSVMADHQKEITLLGSSLEKEQKEIDISGKAIESVTNDFRKFATAENSVHSVVDFHAKCDALNFQLRSKARRIKHAIELGTERRASIDLIPMTEFRAQIKTIKHKQAILSPIFSPKEAQLYFTLPLVRMVWKDETVQFYIRIPLVDFAKRYEISPINKASSNKLSNYDYILTSSDGKYFRFLSDAELKNCIKTKGQFISDLRIVQSSLRMLDCNQLGCTGKNDNGPFEITQLTTNTFAYSSSIEQNATLLCKKSRERAFLPREGFITIPADCSLMSNLFDIDFFPQDESFQKLSSHMKFAVSELKIDLSTSEGKWHLGLDKLKMDVHSNAAQMDEVKLDMQTHMGEMSADLDALHSDNEYLQSQVYGGIGIAGFLTICFIIAGICLCRFLKRRFATFVKV